MQPSGNFSLYFHVPFCTRKCDYCHFYVIPDQAQFKAVYLKALKKEWELRSQKLPKKGLASIYFGGGTPALLSPESIQTILSWISPKSSCEITLEANPENISLELMEAFKSAGINRVSIGVQSLDNKLLTTLSRTHSAEKAIQAVEVCCKAGLGNLSIDLMYDLPGQTQKSWQHTLDLAVHLPISHLSLYNLTIEPHTVFYKKRKNLILPSQKSSLLMLESAIKKLENHGFDRYEISAFAKRGQISQHNIGYWTNRPFLGLGPSACSYWNSSRFQNIANLNRYVKALQKNEDPTDFQETLTPIESLKESIAIQLRLINGIELQKWPAHITQGLSRLIDSGLLETDNSFLRLTKKGLLFHDTVAEEVMAF